VSFLRRRGNYELESRPAKRHNAQSMPAESITSNPDASRAREFLVTRVVEQAAQEHIPLSDIERRMLSFSETMDAEPDFAASEAFDQQCDQDEYEKKVTALVKNAYSLDKSRGQADAWEQALSALMDQDFYLLVMVEKAGVTARVPSWMPSKKEAFLIGTFILVFGAGAYFLAFRVRGDWARMIFFLVWALALWGISRIKIN
jgi:hypothetical protein